MSFLKDIYYISFYQIHSVLRIIRVKDDLNDWNSLIIISFFQFMNVLVLMEITQITELFNPVEGNNIIFVPIVYLSLCLINYLILIRNNNSKTIIEKFDNKKPKLGLIHSIPLIIYMVISIILLLIFWIQ